MKNVFTVTELTGAIKNFLESGFDIIWVTGEISNLRRPASGHVYFTLKDEGGQIRVVAFRSAAGRMGFDLEDGMKIVCRGRLNVYPARGEYQLIIDAAEPKGLGALQMAFEQLKERLEKEGLFDPSHKRDIPFLPGKIGIVTSPSGAAVRDILNITGRRFPSIDIIIAPAAVQGVEAPMEICDAISDLNSIGTDVIIVTRGGGSLEDLFCFNDERVARAIHSSKAPVISAVGHEIDFTIADFVADLRAPTPSAAAELVVPDRKDLIERIRRLKSQLINARGVSLRELENRLDFVVKGLRDPRGRISDLRMGLDDWYARLETRTRACIDTLRGILQRDMSILDSLSPLSVLKRGFGIVRLSDGTIVKDVAMLAVDGSVDVRVSSGSFKARVTRILKEQNNGREKV
ncbi:MAG: exodeoxyribonuclease VII large subunit [Deltaproteobacteria bacterium]|nr:exodeoxyribonuclease VII large subunit [Deltaproteobacteria bacterium]MBW2595513.1 exodeoxyribonuclease VII large subunit [Deltaproteobacteria bacterium]